MDKGVMLKEIRHYYRLEKNVDFARFMGLTEQNAYTWTKRSTFDLEVVYAHCPEINPEWLLSRGERGEMLRSDAEKKTLSPKAGASVSAQMLTEARETANKALAALAEEQRRLAECQQQQTRLVDLLDKALSK